MPSLRKRVTSYFRQLSFHNEPREKRHNFIENTFILKYLQGEIKLKEGPPIIYGKNPTDLPNYEVGVYGTGDESIVGCYTGPHGGLTTVKRSEKHLTLPDQDLDFIDTADEAAPEPCPTAPAPRSPNRNSDAPLDNTTMVIKVAGQEYYVTNVKKGHNKSHSLGSLSDLRVEIDKTKRMICTNNNDDDDDVGPNLKRQSVKSDERCDRICDSKDRPRRVRIDAEEPAATAYALGKSKSEGDPFAHKKTGKITRLQRRPTGNRQHGDGGGEAGSTAKDGTGPPEEWDRKSEHVYGISDSLYDRNLVTKVKNGDPIADCFGIIARYDSAILAVADGVNWGEKACIAAKSAIHGCLHYLNRTIFLDSRPFEGLVRDVDGSVRTETTPIHEARVGNTREVFVCLLRAFNCAHDLILENNGMLTTLTVAIVLPLKRRRDDDDAAATTTEDGYVCCVCNVGDTLAYVYSQKYGIRELTKGSHDINCNRDMRDALGALGPVDGINPELSNLTLSITTIQKGDIVLVASDGLTDNFDPNVCKFTVNSEVVKARKPSVQQAPSRGKENLGSNRNLTSAPVKPPRRNQPGRTTQARVDTGKVKKAVTLGTAEVDNPLVAQFLKENSLDETPSASSSRPPTKSASARDVPRTLSEQKYPLKKSATVHAGENKYGFLRSKTSLDMRATKSVARNADGIPYVTPLQRYELTLLLIEDILKRGISGKENQCVTAKRLCENLVSFTTSITNAKRRTLEDADLYFNNQNGVLVEVSHQEKKLRRKRGLERVQNLPGKLDHVTVAACNVGNTAIG